MEPVEMALEVWRAALMAYQTFRLLSPLSRRTGVTTTPISETSIMAPSLDINRWLAERNIPVPGREASVQEREAYIAALSAQVGKTKDAELTKSLVSELDKARRNLKQKRYRDGADRHTMNPILSNREVAILDWIALQIYVGGKGSFPNAETTNSSRNTAIRFLIDEYAKGVVAKLGTVTQQEEFERKLKQLEQHREGYQNTWRSRTSILKSPNEAVRQKAPKPPGL